MKIKSAKRKGRIEKAVACAIFILGFLMLFMVPSGQTPDEYIHLQLMGNALENKGFGKELFDNLREESYRIQDKKWEQVDYEEQNRIMWGGTDYDPAKLVPQGINLGIVKYFPALTGILIGILFKLPAYWVLQLGEIMCLLFYTFVCFHALRILPVHKTAMGAIMLLPMAIQQAGGVGNDSVVIPLSFYLVCYIFYLRFEKEVIVLKDVLIVLGVWFVVTYTKLPYAFLILLVFMLPLRKMHIKLGKFEIDEEVIKKYRIPALLALACIFIIGLYFCRNNKWIQIVYGFFAEWRQGLMLIKNTFIMHYPLWIKSIVGTFGWMDTAIKGRYAMLVLIMLAGLCFVNAEEKGRYRFKAKDRVIVWGVALLTSLFVMLSMLNHTIMFIYYGNENLPYTYEIRKALYEIPYIMGVQGRYFIPYLFLFFAPLPQVGQVGTKKMTVFAIACEAVLFIYTGVLLMYRFWK